MERPSGIATLLLLQLAVSWAPCYECVRAVYMCASATGQTLARENELIGAREYY